MAANLEIYSIGNSKFVDPFALAEVLKGQMTIKLSDFFLIAQGKTIKFTRGSSTGILNGKPFIFTKPTTSGPLVYLVDLQKIFKFPSDLTYTIVDLDPTVSAASVPAVNPVTQKPTQQGTVAKTFAPAQPAVQALPYSVGADNSTTAEGLLKYGDLDWAFLDEITPASAYDACLSGVSVSLKSPASAQYNPGARVISYPNKVWGIYGYVDSQNSYGALLRSSYTCIIQRKNDLHSQFFIDISTR